MSTDVLTPAVLQYIENGAYPESEDVASAEITSTTLQSLSKALEQEQETVKSEIREISRNAGTDIDTWIIRAKQLQADILRSRETARQIVAEAEAGKELKAKAEDRRKKVELLESEVAFQDNVSARLEHVKFANGLLQGVQDCLVEGQIEKAVKKLEDAEESVNGIGSGGVMEVLGKKVDRLKGRLAEAVAEGWSGNLLVDVDEKVSWIKGGLEELVAAAKCVGNFDRLVGRYASEFERAIVKPRLVVGKDGRVPRITVVEGQISCKDLSEEASVAAMLKDLSMVVDFLDRHLPSSVAIPLSDILIPALYSRLEEDWLDPAVPIDLAEMPDFQDVLSHVSDFSDNIDRLGWHGSKSPRDWVQSAPRTWLTKRREAVLGDVRNLVFTGLRETKVAERVETQIVRNEDTLTQGGEGGDDEWDTAWDEPEEQGNPSTEAQSPTVSTNDDEDASAWDEPDEEDPPKANANENGEDDAWGWGENNENDIENTSDQPFAKSKSPEVNGHNAHQQPTERELTLRETFTVTAVPDAILELLQHIITDAETLAGPKYQSSPIAPAGSALYTLPTLALAIYRATAPTTYAKLSAGNMLIYNDANRLLDQLQLWQTSRASNTRLRLDNDIKALGQFAKIAYSAEMESQRIILRDLLDGAQGFSSCTAQPFRAECESAVEQTIDRLQDVYNDWKPVLSQSALLQSIGSLLATVTKKMISDIEDLPDIGENESQQLKRLCDRVSKTKRLFVQQAPGSEGGDERDMTFIYCPNWLKFQYLAEILESSLADIRYLWKDGELSLEFEPEEVVGLIEALFAESTLRRQGIVEIRRGGGGR